MKFINYLLIAIVIVTTSCKNDDFYEDLRVMTASVDQSSFAGLTLNWIADEQIIVSNDNGETATITLKTVGNPTTTEGIISADGTSFSFAVPKEGWNTVYGVYPASCAKEEMVSSGTVNIEIPRKQDGTFKGANISAAKSANDYLIFKNTTAIVNIVPENPASSIANDLMYFCIADKTLAGDFTISFSDDGSISSVAATSGGATINTISGKISDPTSSYYAIAPISITTETNMNLKVRKAGTNLFASKTYIRSEPLLLNTLYTFTYNFTAEEYTEKELPGEFSVDSLGTKVYFSQGNLFCKRSSSTSSDWTWCFYEHQYDMNSLTTAPSRTATDEDTEIDLFTWGYTSHSTIPTTMEYLPGTKDLSGPDDWGSKIGFGWRTLSQEEWEYLLGLSESNPRASLCKFGVTVCGHKSCLILAPDNYKKSLLDNYSEAAWAEAEADGLVCLPAAGYRYGAYAYGAYTFGAYWSSTVDNGRNAYYMGFDNGGLEVDDDYRYIGRSVRLVRE